MVPAAYGVIGVSRPVIYRRLLREKSRYRRGMSLMAPQLAPVTPEVLRWARESIGVSVEIAAHRAGVSEDRIILWETGEQEPTIAKARALAKLYQRPFSILFLPSPPVRSFDTLRDFRKLPGSVDEQWSRPMHKVFRRAQDIQASALDLLADEGETPFSQVPGSHLQVAPEEAARRGREALGVSIQQQVSWGKPEEALAGWLKAVESLGVFVLRTSDVSVVEMRGFSITGELPVIVVNALDWPRGQVFTLMHEFAHLMLHESGLCNLREPVGHDTDSVEVWCNAVAAALLMPAEQFLDHDALRTAGPTDWEDDFLNLLSAYWGVSHEAIVRRLVTLGRATPVYYSRKRDQYQELYEQLREREKERRRAKTKQGGPPPYRMAIRDQGRPFVRIVLDAYHRDAISPSSASTLLHLKLKHFPNLEREVGV